MLATRRTVTNTDNVRRLNSTDPSLIRQLGRADSDAIREQKEQLRRHVDKCLERLPSSSSSSLSEKKELLF